MQMDTELKMLRKLSRKQHLELTATVGRLQARVATEVFHHHKLEKRVSTAFHVLEWLSKQMGAEGAKSADADAGVALKTDADAEGDGAKSTDEEKGGEGGEQSKKEEVVAEDSEDGVSVPPTP